MMIFRSVRQPKPAPVWRDAAQIIKSDTRAPFARAKINHARGGSGSCEGGGLQPARPADWPVAGGRLPVDPSRQLATVARAKLATSTSTSW